MSVLARELANQVAQMMRGICAVFDNRGREIKSDMQYTQEDKSRVV
jgi:hypothetical protein